MIADLCHALGDDETFQAYALCQCLIGERGQSCGEGQLGESSTLPESTVRDGCDRLGNVNLGDFGLIEEVLGQYGHTVADGHGLDVICRHSAVLRAAEGVPSE